MLESMFGDGLKVDPKELDSDAIKEMWAEAHKAKGEAAKREGRQVVADKTIVISKLPIAPEFGIDPDYLPELVNIHEWSKSKGEKVDKLYYQCKVCQHEAQNRASMLKHTRKCFKFILQCKIYQKLYQGVEYLEGSTKVSLRLLDQVQPQWQQSNLSSLF